MATQSTAMRYSPTQIVGATTTNRYSLRPYQRKAIKETIAWMRKRSGNPVMWLPTASGKSVLVAELCRLTNQSGGRAIMVVPSKELAEQNHEKIAAFVGIDKVGVISAAMGRRDDPTKFDLIVATIGTIARVEPGNLGRVNLVIIDECHLVNPRQTGMYRKLIAGLQRYNQNLRVIGLTATPYRGNGVWLHASEESLFHGIATRIEMQTLLNDGYLSPLVPARPRARMKADGVRIDSKTGDFSISDLAATVNKRHLVEAACKELVELGHDRQRWMVFCVTIEHAEHVCSMLKSLGVSAVLITGKTPRVEREQSIALFRSGHYRAIVNVAALTTGFDVPEIDLIALLRNTRSPVLYTQIAGRGMRIADGKQDCLWCDFTDSTAILGPVDRLEGRTPSKKKVEPALRKCPECGEQIHTGFANCPVCGAEIPKEEREMVNHMTTVMGADVLTATSKQVINEHKVDSVSYHKHIKRNAPDAPPTMRVDYQCGLRSFSEWVCIEHSGYARAKAILWWQQHMTGDMPKTVDDAISICKIAARIPACIVVEETGKYPAIKGKKWETSE